MALTQTTWAIGNHKVEFEAPDVFHIRLGSVSTLEDWKEFVKIYSEQIIPDVDCPVIWLINLHESSGALRSDIRKYLGTVKVSWGAIGIIGGNAIARAAGSIVVRAINLLSGHPIPVRFVTTEADAYTFVNEIRTANNAKTANAS